MSFEWEASNQRFAVQLTNTHATYRHVQAVALGQGRCKALSRADFTCSASPACDCTAHVSWSAFADACYVGEGVASTDRVFVVPLFVQHRQWDSRSSYTPHTTYQREQYTLVK